MMKLEELLSRLNEEPPQVQFTDVINVIDILYKFTPARFINNGLVNEAGQNNGACKIFSFAEMHDLTEQQVLNCFGDYYRVDVLQHPHESSHKNIRNFMKAGWQGVSFETWPLAQK